MPDAESIFPAAMVPAARIPDATYQVSPAWRRVGAALSTLAFPMVWYGLSVFNIWVSFIHALAKRPENEQIYVWRQHGVAIGDFIFFAAALWLLHVVTMVFRRAAWRSIPPGFRGFGSVFAGGLTFGVAKATALIAESYTGRAFPEIVLVAVFVAILSTLFMPEFFRWVIAAPTGPGPASTDPLHR